MSINKAIFEMMNRKEQILEEIKILERLLEFHSNYGVIKNPKEYESHMDDILDRINELNRELKDLE